MLLCTMMVVTKTTNICMLLVIVTLHCDQPKTEEAVVSTRLLTENLRVMPLWALDRGYVCNSACEAASEGSLAA